MLRLTLPLREGVRGCDMSAEWFSVGEFSKMTGLSVKTLRFYHEKGILVPTRVDESSGYRYYDENKIERARAVVWLRELEFSIEEIAAILNEADDEAGLFVRLESQKERIAARMKREREILQALDALISGEKEAQRMLETAGFQVEEKTLEPMLMAGHRMKGKYSECGKGFSFVSRAVGRYICGKPFCLYYDCEYRDDDADIETCFPIRKEVRAEGISVRPLPRGPCLALIHKGPYPQLARSYEKILRTVQQRKAKISLPTREVYLKGPGMIFKGNPKNYLTEIQLPLAG
jgi:DNA-binding transcriptional MerR regulator/effector-binding domain-containing protein